MFCCFSLEVKSMLGGLVSYSVTAEMEKAMNMITMCKMLNALVQYMRDFTLFLLKIVYFGNFALFGWQLCYLLAIKKKLDNCKFSIFWATNMEITTLLSGTIYFATKCVCVK